MAATIEKLRNAGIKVWMLTGDKVETAICIAISTNLKPQKSGFFLMKELTDSTEIKDKLDQFRLNTDSVLVIDGVTLTHTLLEYRNKFIEEAKKAPAVVFSRCSPT